MKKIALATAALLLASGAAFAENPNVGWKSSLPETTQTSGSHAASTIVSGNPGTHPADQYNSQLNTGR